MMVVKRIIAVILMCSIALLLFACGEFNFSGGTGDSTNKNPTGSDTPPDLDDDPNNDFTVQLTLDDQPFSPATAVNVYWNDGYNVHVAPVDDNGYAAIDGLDGDYKVTLSSVPAGYSYDPNAYIATNDSRNVVIEMKDLNMLRGSGDSLENCYEINAIGVYTVTVEDEDDFSYIRFTPPTSGTYTIKSWVSASEDEINPVCLAYLGSAHYTYGEYKVTDVGVCGNYTRNFVHTLNVAKENISSSGGGSVTFTFAVGAETKSGVYPVNITFAIDPPDDYALQMGEKKLMVPSQDWSAFDFDAFNALAGGEFVYTETLYPGTTDSYVFDDDNYKLWPVSEGGDGVYHVYNPEKYPETGGYGPILVAFITSAFRFSPMEVIQGAGDPSPLSFIGLDDRSGALMVNQYNYRAFIRGYKSIAAAGFYCVSDCPCHSDGSVLACLAGCTGCKPQCTPCTEEEMAITGYADLVNEDGVVPVTEELKEFLQLFVINRYYYFADGEGTIEESYGIDAYEDSMWLYACAYYAE